MKRKVVCSFLILIVAIICCGCGVETRTKSISNYQQSSSYEYEEKFESDITYKKDADDYTPKVYITRYGEHYHKPYCSHAKNVYIFLTVRQAINKGYTACYYCCY